MQYRDVDWCVRFEICVNGEEVSWEDLTDDERAKILHDIESDYYYGNFTYEGEEDEDYDPYETKNNDEKEEY